MVKNSNNRGCGGKKRKEKEREGKGRVVKLTNASTTLFVSFAHVLRG